MASSPKNADQVKVAVVGTGMAGLVTAWLLQNDSKRRYTVKVFENGSQPSLDAASVTVVDPISNMVNRVDVPMRAFTEGYYHNLKSMYDFFGVQYQVQPFLFSFSRLYSGGKSGVEDQYFIHASNNHELPPRRPKSVSLLTYLSELLFVVVCYVWFGTACLLVPAKVSEFDLCETFDAYLGRIRLPAYFTRFYLLPLMSAVTTCTHQALLDFPAKDVVDYKRCITSGRQLVVSEGVGAVQDILLRDLDVCYNAQVGKVEPSASGIKLEWSNKATEGKIMTESFQKVILAVPPNVVGSLFEPLRKSMSKLPTTEVTTVVHKDLSAVPSIRELRQRTLLFRFGVPREQSQIIHLRTSSQSEAATEATHVQASGAMVTSCPLRPVADSAIVRSSTFTRVLRTPESRQIVNRMLGPAKTGAIMEKPNNWMNGDDGVYLVGSWCWDGMVLLEGCVVSATRTVQALGIQVPWVHFSS